MGKKITMSHAKHPQMNARAPSVDNVLISYWQMQVVQRITKLMVRIILWFLINLILPASGVSN